MSRRGSEITEAGLLSPAAFLALSAMMLAASVFRGGNRAIALMGLEWLGLLFLVIMAIQVSRMAGQPAPAHVLRPQEKWLLSLPGVFALIYLLPLPSMLVNLMPGRQTYQQALPALSADPTWLSLSVVPDATWVSLLCGVALVAAYLGGRLSDRGQFETLLKILVVVAVVQSILGLMQATRYTKLYFGAEFASTAIGTFANSNHFANFIVMMMPLAYQFLWHSLTSRSRGKTRFKIKPGAMMWALASFFMWVGVLVSASRTGVLMALLVTAISAFSLLGELKRNPRWRWILAAACLALVVTVAAVGMTGFMGRVMSSQASLDAGTRWQMISTSFELAIKFLPLGSGPGTFEFVYPLIHPSSMKVTVAHAHCDYAEFLVEWGILAVVVFGLVLWMFQLQLTRLVRHMRQSLGSTTAHRLQLACLIGLVAILLHSLVDFNMRIPANAMLAALLMGGFMRAHLHGESSTQTGNNASAR
jgi:nitrate reductase NapE component